MRAHQRPGVYSSPRHAGFTLIELLIVIAIIAILAVVVVLVLNPAELLKRSRDTERLSDAQSLTSALDLYNTDQSASQSFDMGSSSVLYVSVPDPSATSTPGDECQGLGLPALPTGWIYHCAASSTFHNVDGTGWLPVDLKNISSGSPLGALPVDPVNQTSTYDYYTYATNGTEWQFYAHFESDKDVPDEAATGGYDPASYKIGTNVNIAPFAGGMTGYWPFDEGSGGTTADLSGYAVTGTLYGGTTWANMSGRSALTLDGNTGYVQLANNESSTIQSSNGFTVCAWVDPNTGSSSHDNYYDIVGDLPSQFQITSYSTSPNYFGPSLSVNYSYGAGASYVFYTGGWHEICAMQSSTGVATLYVDGLQVGSGNQTSGSPSALSYQYAVFGATDEAGKEYFFSGSMGSVHLYQRILSPQEINEMFSQGS